MLKVLLVEGPEDKSVIQTLGNQHDLGSFAEIRVEGSYDQVRKALMVVPKEGHVTHIGVIVDADQSVERRWQSISDVLKRAHGIDLPKLPDANGTIIRTEVNQKMVAIGIWLMPNNQENGILEDFLRLLISDKDEQLAFAEKTLGELNKLDLQKFTDLAYPKALIYTWLAWQKSPEKSIEIAIKSKYFKNEELAKIFTDWLKRLFNS